MTTEIRYTPPIGGLCAIEPKALEIVILEPPKPREPYSIAGGRAAVVEISGPICYAGPMLDTYEQIRARFEHACHLGGDTIILKINSPGGDVAGAFDTARFMRARAAAAGKRLVGFTEASACSSGYALISAASEIYVSDTGTLGSIGVISALENRSVQNAALGLRHYVIASGARKADGNANIPLTEDAIAAIQSSVDQMAARFFALVQEHRGSRLPAPQALEAGTRIGASAVEAGLADAVLSWDSLCSAIASGALGAIPVQNAVNAQTPQAMADEDKDKKESARAALAKAAESDDKDESARAKRALAAWDDDDKKAKASDEDKEKEAKASDSDSDEDKEKAKAAAAAAAATSAQASALAAQLQAQALELAALKSESEARKAADAKAQRAQILASRPDLAPSAVAALEAVPTSALAAVLDTIPRAFVPTLARAPITGDSRGSDRSAPEVARALDEAFGIGQQNLGVVFDGVVQSFGVPVPKGGNK